MNKLRSIFSLILVVALFFSFRNAAPQPIEAKSIKWHSFEEAVELNKDNPKKMFIDVYTDWCGWCKKMDKTTFTDPDIVAFLNENFYPVKFDAEQKEDINFKGHTLKYLPDVSRRGVHELAYALLDGRLGYPAYVYLDDKQDRITISPGYKEAPDLMSELLYIAEEHYKTTSFQDFKKQQQP